MSTIVGQLAVSLQAHAQDVEDPNFDYLEPDVGLLSTWSRIQESLFRKAAHPASYSEAKRLLIADMGRPIGRRIGDLFYVANNGYGLPMENAETRAAGK